MLVSRRLRLLRNSNGNAFTIIENAVNVWTTAFVEIMHCMHVFICSVNVAQSIVKCDAHQNMRYCVTRVVAKIKENLMNFVN